MASDRNNKGPHPLQDLYEVRLPMLGPSDILDRTVIGLGASTGGTEATQTLLHRLPADIPPMVIVQHMPDGYTAMYAERLARHCAMQVREARQGDRLTRGVVLIAPAGLHTTVVRIGGDCCIQLQKTASVSGHRPSADVLLRSISKNANGPMVGILLTGMGKDGAAGLLEIKKSGGYTLAQDKATSVVYGMPRAAAELGAVCDQKSIYLLPDLLIGYLNSIK
ncbi:MAG: chemotaxis protein CheB [Firmicutes bacterium]|nr:chemotaxis protein CheB [Bacillota bacterium]